MSGSPLRRTTTGSPSRIGRARVKRHDTTANTMIQKASVPTERSAPVMDMSSWVTPCWIRSPIVTSRINSKAVISDSSRLPVPRATSHRKK